MNRQLFPGARWWKFDFHTHTPASDDFSDKDQMEPKLWLKKFMEEKIDCVAITDHNSGGWIDCLKQKLWELEENENKPDWYRPLYLFPGVEISTYDDVHLLAIFGCDKDESHIDRLLGAVRYSGTKGKSDGVTRENIIQVISEIIKCEGIPIPAHVDKGKGLFQLSGEKLKEVLKGKDISAMELRDDGYEKPQLYKDEKVQWTEIVGSDTHGFDNGAFGTFTWIKMDNPPSIEGLRLALIDGTASVNRDMNVNPNDHAECFMEEIEISNAKYIGRTEPLKCQFSPFLSTIIGGRGSGKSTLLEFIRLVLRRDQDTPEALKQESSRYFNVKADDSVLTEDSKISLIYHKGEICYRLNWSAKEDCVPLEEKKNGNWVPCPGEIKSLFPAYIYSQKQIFEVAKDPRALISIIDDAPEVDFKTINTCRRDLINEYKQIEAKQVELSEKIAMENRLSGELNDLANQIEQIEKSGHREVLQNYRMRQQQLNELNNLESQWKKMRDQLLETRDSITRVDFDNQCFSDHSNILSVLETENEKWSVLHDKLSELSQEAESIVADWHIEKNEGNWMQALKADMAQYKQLRSELEQQEIDPDKYPSLLAQHESIQKELVLINEHRSHFQKSENDKRGVFEKIEENRKTLTEKRRDFLSRILQNNQFVSIEIVPFGDNRDSIEKEIRGILNCGERFGRDIDSLKKSYHENADNRIEVLKEKIKRIRDGKENPEDARFATYLLESLPQESMSDLALWFPGDNLKVTFSTDGGNRQRIEKGSPGQKTAALLAFILSYGDEPLLLDQPEDDLDNELIYNLIVKQLRETKNKRQVIVVTHNANVVVNGDAEMVLPLEVAGGETRVRRAASIQESEVRQAICNILEGGQQAFEQRYKRIHLEM